MKLKYFVTLFIVAVLVSGSVLQPSEAIAKVKTTQHHKNKSNKHRRHGRYGRPQSVEESLMNLEKYFPEYLNWLSYNTFLLESNKSNSIFDNNSVFSNLNSRIRLIENINDWLGTPYKHGGHSQKGVDCSNFTSCMISETLGWKFPCSVGSQSVLVKPIKSIDDMQFGDLIFFSGRNKRAQRLGHVGFYIGNGLFAHSSSGRGVIYTHISQGYYTERFREGGRLPVESMASHLTQNSQ